MSHTGHSLGEKPSVVAWGGVTALRLFPPVGLPRLDAVRLDGTFMLFTVLLAGAMALAIGLIKSLRSPSALPALKAGAATMSEPRRANRLHATLVVTQLSVSMVLLVGATLVGRSLVELLNTDIGITTERVGAALVSFSPGRERFDPRDRTLIDQVVSRLQARPEVASAGASLPPNLPRFRVSFTFPDRTTGRLQDLSVDSVSTTPGYF